jgi:hypothetical protein
MTESASDTFTIEARLRASVALASTLRETALQTRPHYSRDDSDPFSPSVLVSLTPSFCGMIVDHVQAVRFALSTERALECAPLPWASSLRLVDVIVAVGGRVDERRILECADREAASLQGWRGLCWRTGVDSHELVELSVQRLTNEIEGDTPRYAQALDALVRYRASGGDHAPFEAALHARACETRAAYYLGLTRGWNAAMGCCAGWR